MRAGIKFWQPAPAEGLLETVVQRGALWNKSSGAKWWIVVRSIA
jgi:hypothetical protein